MGAYVFDNAWEKERERLSGLESYLDPGTVTVIESLGIGSGWTCLEVAGGGGSIAAWLCRRVGPEGRVVATDIDTRFLDTIDEPNLEVLRHDLTCDELPEDAFDLIHARLLLEHLPDRDSILKRLVSALKPGGWIVVEDMDWGPIMAKPPIVFAHPPSATRATVRLWRSMIAVMEDAGYDATYGRRLPGELVAAGLADVGAESRDRLVWGGSPEMAVHRWSIERLRPALVASGRATDRDVDRELGRVADPGSAWRGALIVAAWGRRPGAAEATPALPMARPWEPIADRLRYVPLFEQCTPAEIDRIAALVEEANVPAGEVLTREGASGSSFFIVGNGTATVTRAGTRLAVIGPGSFFGEVALLTRGLRTATVTADSPMKLYLLDERGFRTLMASAPSVARKVMEGLAERLAHADEAIVEHDGPAGAV